MDRELENRLIKRVLKGDTEAFSALVTEYQSPVYNLALRMLGNREDAEDIAQESFIKAYNSLSSFKGTASFQSWLLRIVTNTCLDELRKSKNRRTVSLSVENEDEQTEELDIADTSLSPDALLDRKLTAESVQRGIKELSPEFRAVLLLREINGLSYDEIGKTLGLEAGTVKSRIARARKKLCEFLIRDGNIPERYSSINKNGGDRQ